MTKNNTTRLFMAALLAAIIIVYVMIFVGPEPTTKPAGKPRKLSPAEQQDSVTQGRRKGKG